MTYAVLNSHNLHQQHLVLPSPLLFQARMNCSALSARLARAAECPEQQAIYHCWVQLFEPDRCDQRQSVRWPTATMGGAKLISSPCLSWSGCEHLSTVSEKSDESSIQRNTCRLIQSSPLQLLYLWHGACTWCAHSWSPVVWLTVRQKSYNMWQMLVRCQPWRYYWGHHQQQCACMHHSRQLPRHLNAVFVACAEFMPGVWICWHWATCNWHVQHTICWLGAIQASTMTSPITMYGNDW